MLTAVLYLEFEQISSPVGEVDAGGRVRSVEAVLRQLADRGCRNRTEEGVTVYSGVSHEK